MVVAAMWWLSANVDNSLIAEEGVSIRAVKRVYRECRVTIVS